MDLNAYQRVAVMHALVTHDLPGAIEQGVNTCEGIARIRGLDAGSLARLLVVAVRLDFLTIENDGSYRLTPKGALLQPSHPRSISHTIRLSVDQYWPAWRLLSQAVRTGQTTFELAHGQTPWQFRREHPEQGQLFDTWQREQSQQALADILSVLDLGGARSVVDIGGGQGTLLEACLDRWPLLDGVLFDQEHTLRDVRARLKPSMADRLKTVAGDFFSGINVKADVYLLKSVLHDWDDTQARQILGQCARAMPGHARLIIVERVLRTDLSLQAHLVDLGMLLVTGGRERTRSEYEDLVSTAGLELLELRHSAGDFSLMECRAVG